MLYQKLSFSIEIHLFDHLFIELLQTSHISKLFNISCTKPIFKKTKQCFIKLIRDFIESHIGKYIGHIDIPRSENGKLQAKEVAKKLENEKFDAVYCSDLLRTKQTLDALRLKTTPIYTKSLREKSWGVHEGKSFGEIIDSGLEYKNFEQWLQVLDGERIEIFIRNLELFFKTVVYKSDSKNILIVTHSGVIKSLYHIIKKCPLEEAFSLKINYTSAIKLSIKKDFSSLNNLFFWYNNFLE